MLRYSIMQVLNYATVLHHIALSRKVFLAINKYQRFNIKHSHLMQNNLTF
jgi:hypothetical protein